MNQISYEVINNPYEECLEVGEYTTGYNGNCLILWTGNDKNKMYLCFVLLTSSTKEISLSAKGQILTYFEGLSGEALNTAISNGPDIRLYEPYQKRLGNQNIWFWFLVNGDKVSNIIFPTESKLESI